MRESGDGTCGYLGIGLSKFKAGASPSLILIYFSMCCSSKLETSRCRDQPTLSKNMFSHPVTSVTAKTVND
jgi:hypothetical protein